MIDITELPDDLQCLIWSKWLAKYHTNQNVTYVLDWMAHMLQYPNIKPKKAILLVGPQGCGKRLFATLLTLLIGKDHSIQTTTLSEHFNQSMEGKTLVHLNGCDIRNELPRIYSLISEHMYTIEAMGSVITGRGSS